MTLLKRIFFALLLIVAVLALGVWLKPPALLRVGANYTAKIVCSNVFLAGRDPDEVLRVDVQAPGIALLKLMHVSVDRERGVVHAGFLGFIGDGLAQWHPGKGCTVLPDGKLGVLDFGATKLLSEKFATVYRMLMEENAAGKTHPNVGPLLLKAGFTFLGDEDEAFDFVQKLADIVQRPIQQDNFDFGDDKMIRDARQAFHAEPRIALTVKPPAEALMFYRSAAGLAQDLRLLKAHGPFRSVLQEITARVGD